MQSQNADLMRILGNQQAPGMQDAQASNEDAQQDAR